MRVIVVEIEVIRTTIILVLNNSGSTRDDYNRNISRNSNNTRNSNSSIGSTSNRRSSLSKNSSKANSSNIDIRHSSIICYV